MSQENQPPALTAARIIEILASNEGRGLRIDYKDAQALWGYQALDSPIDWALARSMRPSQTLASGQLLRRSKDETRNEIQAWAAQNEIQAMEDPMTGEWTFYLRAKLDCVMPPELERRLIWWLNQEDLDAVFYGTTNLPSSIPLYIRQQIEKAHRNADKLVWTPDVTVMDPRQIRWEKRDPGGNYCSTAVAGLLIDRADHEFINGLGGFVTNLLLAPIRYEQP